MEIKYIEGLAYQAHPPFQLSFKKRTKTEQIVVHCAATQQKKNIDWFTIDQMHRQRGFLAIGYHFVILTDGTVQEGRPLDALGAHASGHNDNSIGICLVGGIEKDGTPINNFTQAQFKSLDSLVKALLTKYEGSIKSVVGHRDLPNVNKACPCFDAKARYEKLFK